jgi:hypothetical protein
MASIIDRARHRLSAFPDVQFEATPTAIHVPAPGAQGFSVSLRIEGARFIVRYDGWSQTFGRAEDAYDCFEFGLSDSCALRVTLRGETACRWQIEKREYGLWVPGRTVRRRWVPFWRPLRTERRQNHVFRTG